MKHIELKLKTEKFLNWRKKERRKFHITIIVATTTTQKKERKRNFMVNLQLKMIE